MNFKYSIYIFLIILFTCDTSEKNSSIQKENDIEVNENKISTDNVEKSKNFFKDLDLNLNYKPKDILPSDPIKKDSGGKFYLNNTIIDSIRNVANNFKPTEVLESDIIIIKTNFGNMKLKFFPNSAPKHCYNFKN